MSDQLSVIPKLNNVSFAKQKNDLVVNNTIDFVDTSISFNLIAGKFYMIDLYPFVTSDALADVSFQLVDIPVYANGFWEEGFFKLDKALENVINDSTITGVVKIVEIFIMIQPTTSKTMKLQFAQRIAHPSDTTLHAGSIAKILEA